MNELDPTAIGRGAGIALAIALPAAIVQTVAPAGGLRSLALLVSIAGFGIGGHAAGRHEPLRGVTHGGLAGLAAGVVVLAVGIVRRTITGSEPLGESGWVGLPFLALLALSSGLIGGYVANRRDLSATADAGGDPGRRGPGGPERRGTEEIGS